MMHKWIAVALLIVTVHVERMEADEPPPPLKEGELVELELIGDAARTYARMNLMSLDKAASPVPVLSMHAVLRRVNCKPGIAIEHQHETVIGGDRYLCMLTGTVPANAIERVPLLDLRPATNLANTTGDVPKPMRLRITDFPTFPTLKLQRWKLVSEIDGNGASNPAPENGE